MKNINPTFVEFSPAAIRPAPAETPPTSQKGCADQHPPMSYKIKSHINELRLFYEFKNNYN